MQQRQRGKLSPVQIAVVIAVVLAVCWWGWSQYRASYDEGLSEGGQRGCEIVNDEPCVYDNRFEKWVPESQAR